MDRRDISKAIIGIAAVTGASTVAREAQAQSRTAAESEAGVTPTNYGYRAGDLRRYGATGGPSGSAPTTDDSAAFLSACKTGYVYVPEGWAFKVVTGVTLTAPIVMEGDGPESQLYCDTVLLTATRAAYSVLRNLWIGNVTAPLTIQRYVESIVTTRATTTSGSASITVESARGLAVGMECSGPNVWEDAIITRVSGTTVTLSKSCPLSGTRSPVRLYGVTWNQGPAAVATLAASNADGRYTPNINDQDVWPHLTTQQQQEAQIGPVVSLSGDHIVVESIYGRRLSILLLDGSYCEARGCDFQGGWTWAGIAFLNTQRALRTKHNRAVRNRIHDHGFNGILFMGCDGCTVADNIISGVGETGIKTYQGCQSNGYWDGCSAVNSSNNLTFACYQGSYDYQTYGFTPADIGSNYFGQNIAGSSSIGDKSIWCMMGFGYSGSAWLIDIFAKFVGGNLGPPNFMQVSDSRVRGTFVECNILPNTYPAVIVTGPNNIVGPLRIFNETTRNTQYQLSIGAAGGSTTLKDADLRDSVTPGSAQILYQSGGIIDRYNVRTNGNADLPPRGHIQFTMSFDGNTVTPDLSHGDWCVCFPESISAFTVENPINAANGFEDLTVTIYNQSGGTLSGVTWGSAYKMAAWTSPAAGYNRSITFRNNGGGTWYEMSRNTSDVPN